MLSHDPHDSLSRALKADRKELQHEEAVDAAARAIMEQIRTPEGLEKLIWDHEPPELVEACVCWANGENVKASKALERMVDRLANEWVEREAL